MKVATPTAQLSIATDERRCYTGKYPTLGLLEAAYGNEAPSQWLTLHIADMMMYCGCRDKLSQYQMIGLATQIKAEYYHLKTSEIMLFFFRLKGGHYGQFYGTIDPLKVMVALREFMQERSMFLDKYEKEREAKRISELSKNTITYREYCTANNIEPKEHTVTARSVNDTLKKRKYTPEQILAQARDIIENPNKLNEHYVGVLTDCFMRNHGMSPVEYCRNYAQN